MTKVTMEYLQANGRYRRATATTESQWPNFLINYGDRQAHSLVDSPVFTEGRKAPVFTDWDAFLEATPPQVQHYPDKMMAVCEDQNIWPMCGDVMPDIQDRQMQFKEFGEDAEQNAVASATRAAAGSGMINAWSIASLMIFCIVSAVILLIVLQSNLAKGFLPGGGVPPAPTAALLVMSGLVLPWRKQKGREGLEIESEGKPKRKWFTRPVIKPRPQKFKDFETLRVWDEVSGTVWSASLPLEVILGHIPLDCRYTQELTTARYIAMALFGGLLFLLGVTTTALLGWPLLWALTTPLLIGGVGVLYGYFKGFGSFMLPPIWVVRRMYERILIDESNPNKGYRMNYDALPVIVPEFHTKVTGMPVDMAAAVRRAAAEEVIRVANQGQNKNGGNGSSTTLTAENLAVAYTPRIWRASMLFEMLLGRDIRARMKGPEGKGDKLQKISMAGMALGSVGLLIAAMVFLQ
jgi:hypothetical protein